MAKAKGLPDEETAAARRAAVGAQIRAARDGKRWTQKQVGALAGVDAQTVSNWERGVSLPSFDLLSAVAAGMGRDISYFVEDARVRAEREASLKAIMERCDLLVEMVGALTTRQEEIAARIGQLERSR